MEKLIVVCHGEPDYQSIRLSTRGRRQAMIIAERLREELSQALLVSVITCGHFYPKETAELMLEDGQRQWLCATPSIIYPAACSAPLDTLKLIERETSAWGHLNSMAIVLIGHKEDALYLPIMYGLQHKASLKGFEVGYGEAVVIDCEAMETRIVTSVRE